MGDYKGKSVGQLGGSGRSSAIKRGSDGGSVKSYAGTKSDDDKKKAEQEAANAAAIAAKKKAAEEQYKKEQEKLKGKKLSAADIAMGKR